MKKQPIGYTVIISADDCLKIPTKIDTDPQAPFNALESFDMKGNERIAIFPTRKEARAAIDATHHYIKAHYPKSATDRPISKVVPVYMQETPHA